MDTNNSDLMNQLINASLDELRNRHGRTIMEERLLRAIIREREALAKREGRLRSRGLSVVASGD